MVINRCTSNDKFEKSPSKKPKVSKKEIHEEDPNAIQAVNPSEPTKIKIWNKLIDKHNTHPINKYMNKVNTFCNLSLLKAFNFRSGNKVVISFEINKINNLAKELKIEIPKGMSNQD